MKYKKIKPIVEEIPFLDNDFFNTQTLKNGVWQYLLDHSSNVNGQGTLKVVLFINTENEGEFWYRVKARQDGKFKRNDLIKIKDKEYAQHRNIQKQREKAEKWDVYVKNNNANNRRLQELRKNGTLKQRLLLKLSYSFKQLNKKIATFIR